MVFLQSCDQVFQVLAAHELVLAGDVAMHVLFQQFRVEMKRLCSVVEISDSFTSEQSALSHKTRDKLSISLSVGLKVFQFTSHYFLVARVSEMWLKYLNGLDQCLDGVQVIDAGLGIFSHVKRAELGLEKQRVRCGEQP